MKRIFILLISISVVFASCNKKKVSTPRLSNDKDSVAYFIGALTAKGIKENLKNVDFDKFNKELYVKAIEDVMNGDSIKFNDTYMNEKINNFIQKLRQETADKNMKEGSAFMEKNKTNPGIVITPSGLQYQVIKQGNGPKPDSTDICVVNYRGTLINGEEFEKNSGAKFPVTGVIPGMTEALLKMNVGSKWKLFIPTNLGYGERVRPGGKIKANMALIFELEVLSIEPKQSQQPQQMPAPMVSPLNRLKRK